MFTIINTMTVDLLLNHWNRETFAMVDPLSTKIVLYMFNRRDMSKMKVMNTFILDNKSFVNPLVYKDMVYLFRLAQKTYWGMHLFARIWKQKHMTSKVNTDLLMTDLSEYPSKSKITLYEHGSCYEFKLSDLNNIIMNAFTHCSHDYFLEIKSIKNPYTNIPFTLANIYNIYIAFNESKYKIPILLQGYIQCKCNTNEFMRVYEPLIREYCINKTISEMSAHKLSREIRKTIRDDDVIPNYIKNNITIHRQFPWKTMNEDFRSCVFLYHRAKFSLNPFSKFNSKMELIKKLCLFINDNPQYGRKIMNVVKQKPITNKDVFVFGSRNRYYFNTTIKTPFNKMTKEERNTNYSSLRRSGLLNTPVRHDATINNIDTSDDDTSDDDNDSDNESIVVD